jgi:hypothetical protein
MSQKAVIFILKCSISNSGLFKNKLQKEQVSYFFESLHLVYHF